MEILTAAEMAAADRRTASDFGVPLATLMENAGASVARFCLAQYAAAERVALLCGKGNNGGDGFVAARALAAAELQVDVILLGRAAEVQGEAALALRRLRREASSVAFHEAADETSLHALEHLLLSADLILDAVVGTGFQPPLRGLAVAARDLLARASAPVVVPVVAPVVAPVIAIDLPSGWDVDSIAETAPGAFRASAVVTFTRPKRAHIFGSLTGSSTGAIVVADIGSPPAAITSGENLHWTGNAKSIAEPPRPVNSNKGMYGHVLIIGGSYGTAGAPSMSSLAALRTGAGLVTAAVPRSIAGIVSGFAPELMLAPLAEGPGGAVSLENLSGDNSIAELIQQKRVTVLALGPGLSQRGDASEFARRVVAETKIPLVLDADGLNAFAGRAAELNGAGRTLVLTPHPGEMARLTGLTVAAVEADRIALARRFAAEHSLTLILKGWRTLVAHPDGRVAVNTTGNPALAKGGSGDILTGIVAAMLAQFPHDAARAVEAAVFLHGLAGDLAARDRDEHTILATDTVAHLSAAFRDRVQDAGGLTWIAGNRLSGIHP